MKEEHKRIILQWFVPLLCAATIISVMFYWFSVNVRSDAETEISSELTESAQRYALKAQQELELAVTAGEAMAYLIENQNIKDRETIVSLLNAIIQETGVSETVYYGNQLCIDHQGENAAYILLENGVRAQRDETEKIEYIYISESEYRDQAAVRIAIPVSEDNGQLFLYYPLQQLQRVVNIEGEFDERAFMSVIDVEGNIFFKGNESSEFLMGDNLWDNMDKTVYENTIMKIRVRIQNGSVGSMEVQEGEESRTLAFAPMNIGTWTLVLFVDQKYVNTWQERSYQEVMKMLYQFLSVVVVFVIVLFAVNMIGKRHTEEKRKELQEKADMDLLTGLNNKLATERKIKEYLSENPGSLAMMFVLDIDNFKKINDTMGHAFGDEVLRSIGKQISANFRVTDIIGRTGGDEFTILLKNLKDETIIDREAQKLVYFFQNFQVGEYVKYSATASIGAAVFPTDGKDFDALYKSADHALYKAKKRGKNQLAFFTERNEQN